MALIRPVTDVLIWCSFVCILKHTYSVALIARMTVDMLRRISIKEYSLKNLASFLFPVLTKREQVMVWKMRVAENAGSETGLPL